MKTFHFQHTFAQKVPQLQEKLTQLQKDIQQDQPLKKLADDLVAVESYLLGWYLRYYKMDTKGSLEERLHTLSVSHKLDRSLVSVFWEIKDLSQAAKKGADGKAKRKDAEDLARKLDQTLLADVAKKLNETVKPKEPREPKKEDAYSGPHRSDLYYLKKILGMRQKSEYKLDWDKLNILGNGVYLFSPWLGLVNTVLATLCCSWQQHLVYAHKIQLLRESEESNLPRGRRPACEVDWAPFADPDVPGRYGCEHHLPVVRVLYGMTKSAWVST